MSTWALDEILRKTTFFIHFPELQNLRISARRIFWKRLNPFSCFFHINSETILCSFDCQSVDKIGTNNPTADQYHFIHPCHYCFLVPFLNSLVFLQQMCSITAIEDDWPLTSVCPSLVFIQHFSCMDTSVSGKRTQPDEAQRYETNQELLGDEPSVIWVLLPMSVMLVAGVI